MSLLTNLVSYWKLDEASGNALDAHGTNDLTDNNTVGIATGKISNARDFEAGNSEYFSRADNADLSTGDIDFTVACWVQAESLALANPWIAGKSSSGGANEEWRLDYFSSRFRFVIHNASTYRTATANSLGAPSLATWYFIVAWHDAAANTVNIQINNGSVDSTATSGTAPADSTGPFGIGSQDGVAATFWDGLIDELGFWKRVLTSQERTDLYNSGNGLDYGSFGGAAGHPAMRRTFGGIFRPLEIGREGVLIA